MTALPSTLIGVAVQVSLTSHPTLARALGPIIGNDEFQVQILGGQTLTSLASLISGLMESADGQSGDGFPRTALKLNALLDQGDNKDTRNILGDLNLGYDVVLFHGLCLEEKLEIGDGFLMLPYEQARNFIDDDLLKEVAPREVSLRDWRLMGVVVRPFHWKPVFRDKYTLKGSDMKPPIRIERDVLEFLDLLAITHQTPITYLMSISGCVKRSTCNLLGQNNSHGGFSYGRSILGKHNGFAKIPKVEAKTLEKTKSIFQIRKSSSYFEVAVVIRRLSEALSRNGPFALGDRVIDTALALELMFISNGKGIGWKLQNAVAELLEDSEEGKEQVKKEIKHFYDVRSAIVHGPVDAKKKRLLAECSKAFQNGFDLAQRSLFKKLNNRFH